MDTRIGIVMPTLIQFELGLKALASVKTKYWWTPYICPVWKDRIPLAQSWNNGINSAREDGCQYIIVINDDVILSPWTVDNLVAALESDENIALATGWSVPLPISGNHESMANYPEPQPAAWVQGADFACFAVRENIFDFIGTFDENFTPAYYEDNDFHRRIALSGLDARIITTAPFFHYGSQTQNERPVGHFAFDLCTAYYKKKWGGGPAGEIYSTPYNDPNLTYKDWRKT